MEKQSNFTSSSTETGRDGMRSLLGTILSLAVDKILLRQDASFTPPVDVRVRGNYSSGGKPPICRIDPMRQLLEPFPPRQNRERKQPR